MILPTADSACTIEHASKLGELYAPCDGGYRAGACPGWSDITGLAPAQVPLLKGPVVVLDVVVTSKGGTSTGANP